MAEDNNDPNIRRRAQRLAAVLVTIITPLLTRMFKKYIPADE